MSPFAAFIQELLREGQVRLREPPPATPDPDPQAVALLEQAFAGYRLSVAGPLIEFDPGTALAAAALVRHSCWFLVSHDQPAEELARLLAMPRPPKTPAQHLSGDLLLRLLPSLHRRARARDPADPLTHLLAQTLRQWPLAGVLADVEEGPETALDFGGHPGLRLLYAERWARNPRPAWLPRGPGRAEVELVWAELGKDPAALPGAADEEPTVVGGEK